MLEWLGTDVEERFHRGATFGPTTAPALLVLARELLNTSFNVSSTAWVVSCVGISDAGEIGGKLVAMFLSSWIDGLRTTLNAYAV